MEKIQKKIFCGKLCWTSARACAKENGIYYNTMKNWVKKTKSGEMNMPILGNLERGCNIRIPVVEFLAWLNFQ